MAFQALTKKETHTNFCSFSLLGIRCVYDLYFMYKLYLTYFWYERKYIFLNSIIDLIEELF